MKITSILSFLFLASLFISCKGEPKKDIEEKQVAQEPFTVVINMTAKEDDIMTLYYMDNTMDNFMEDVSIYKEVKKGDQEIVIALPEGYLPKSIRFDLSTKEPKFVKLIRSTFQMMDKVLTFLIRI